MRLCGLTVPRNVRQAFLDDPIKNLLDLQGQPALVEDLKIHLHGKSTLPGISVIPY
jgi:hypothetical protein